MSTCIAKITSHHLNQANTALPPGEQPQTSSVDEDEDDQLSISARGERRLQRLDRLMSVYEEEKQAMVDEVCDYTEALKIARQTNKIY